MKRIFSKFYVVFALVSIAWISTSSALLSGQPHPATSKKQGEGWEQLKYGMFIHFNMNTFAGAEYDNGKMSAESFNPSNLDVDQWISTARDAGMKYAVLTAKHTGGFCLWDSKVVWKGEEYNYDIASSGYKKDIVAQFIGSCRKYDIKPALYYCLWDDHNEPVSSKDEYFQLTKGHITELVTSYKGLVELWIDIPSRLTSDQRIELYNIVKRHQPDCLVTCNNGFTDGSVLFNFPADITNGERTLPPATGHNPVMKINGKEYYIPMEVCQTINQNWFWLQGDVTKSVRTLYYWYSESIKRGANFLLDVPPDLSGQLPADLIKRLLELKEVIDNPYKLPPLKTLTGYKPVEASSLFNGRVEYLPESAVDEDPDTRWLARTDDALPSLTVDLGKPMIFNTVRISEPYESHIRSFKVQYLNGREWKTIIEGDNVGSEFMKKFPPVEAGRIRILVTKFITGRNQYNVLSFPGEAPPLEGVTLAEFQVLNEPKADAGWSQKEIPVNYVLPYQYKLSEGKYLVKAWLDISYPGRELEVILDGKQVQYSRTDSGTVEVFLPLAGNTGELMITSDNKEVISKQIFRPLIPSDWGYFGKGTIHIICSSHQDIAWMNTPDSCREERIHDIIIPALDQIDKNPDFRFEMEQTLNLMEVLEAVPAEKQRIIEAYKKGQFTWGATFNQPYEGLESGEQLVRQTYLGRKWIKDNLPGMDAFAAYNIDVPGRTPQIPQILDKSGIKFLVISRMKEGFYNWYSPDGSRVLTYSPGNYGWALLVYQYFEGDVVTAFQKLNKVLKNWDDYYAEHNLPPHYGVVISTDAGGPKDYTPIIDKWNAIAKNSGLNIPVVRHSTAEDFLHEIDVPQSKFDSISGERPDLWLYIHGPAHYEAIKAKKSAAVSLPAAEIFSAVNGVVRSDLKSYPSKELSEGWYNSIYPDHGWGGKNGEITDSIFRASLEAGNETGQKILSGSLKALSELITVTESGSVVVFNDLSWNRNGIVDIDVTNMKGTDWIITDPAGEAVPSALYSKGSGRFVSFIASNVPSVGYKTYCLKKAAGKIINEAQAGNNFCENSFFRIEFGQGGITNLFDKQQNRELLNTTKYAGGDLLHFGYNGNGAGEFVRITPVNYEGYESLSMKKQVWTLKSNTAVSSVYESIAAMSNFTVKQIITVYHQIKKIDFEYEIPDWPGVHNRQIRAVFPLAMSDAQVTYDVPMGIVNVNKDELNMSPRGWSWEGTYRQMPREIHPREIENFVSASDDRAGVTMSTNLAVADWIDPGRESVDYPVLQGILLSSHKSCHYLGNWYHQKGSHRFRFSLTSHNPGWKNGYHFGVEGNHPLNHVLIDKTQKGTLPAEMSFLSVSSPLVRVTALKKDDKSNSLILRMVNMESKDKTVNMKIWFPAASFVKTNMIEEDINDTGQKGRDLKINLGKNSIETFRIGLTE